VANKQRIDSLYSRDHSEKHVAAAASQGLFIPSVAIELYRTEHIKCHFSSDLQFCRDGTMRTDLSCLEVSHASLGSHLAPRAIYKFLYLKPVIGAVELCSVSVLDSGAGGPGFKSQSRRCRVAVLGKLFTPIVPLFTKQQNW